MPRETRAAWGVSPHAYSDWARRMMSAQAQIFERQAGTFSKITADLQILSGKVHGFFVGVADQVAPVLLPLLESIKNIDLVHLGQQAGYAVRLVVGAFQQGRLGELIGASLKVGVGEGINYLAGAIPPVASFLGELIKTDLEGGIDAMIGAFGGVFQIVEGGLLKAFESPVRYLQAGIENVMQTAQHLKDRWNGKEDDTSAARSMTPAERRSTVAKLNAQNEALTTEQFGETDDTGDRGIHSPREIYLEMMKNPVYRSNQDNISQLNNYDPSKYATHVQSIEEILEQNKTDPVRFGPNGGRTGDQLIADGGAQVGVSLNRIIASSGKIAEAYQKATGDIHPVQIVNTKKDRDTIASIGASLAGATVSAPGNLAAAGGPSAITGFGRMQEGDRLARIGGFIGGSGGPALDFHRRTAAATERTAQGVQALVSRMSGINVDPVVVWG